MYEINRAERLLKGFSLPILIFASLFIIGCATYLQPRVGFQGQLTDTGGNPVSDGTYDMTIRFYSSEAATTSIFTETKTIAVTNGLFDLDIDDFPPHIFSSGVAEGTGDSLFMEVEVNGEVLSPRRRVPGAAYAHALVAGSGVIGPRPDEDNANDGGFGAALAVVNSALPGNNPGYGISARAANAGLFADNVTGDGAFGPSSNPEDNPDIILGGEYVADGDGNAGLDTLGGPGVLASDPALLNSDLYLRSSDELWLYKNYDGSGGTNEFRVYDNGNTNVQLRLNDVGNLTVDGTVMGGGADYAEQVAVEGSEFDYEPGDVLVISDDMDRAVELASEPYSSRVIGVYSADPGFLGGAGTPEEQLAREDTALAAAGFADREAVTEDAWDTLVIDDGAVEVAIAGIVPVKVSAENGAIQRGDLLTTAATPGHAMKATQLTPGTILGKAMGTLESGTGVISVLVILQ